MYMEEKDFFKQVSTGFAFDDFLLSPDYSEIMSRSAVDLSSRIVSDIIIHLPIISANMDSITEHKMVNAMLACGATGVLHRFMNFDEIQRELDLIASSEFGYIGISVGADFDETEKRLQNLRSFGFAIVDLAHGCHKHVKETVTEIKMKFPDIPIIAGNICTASAAKMLIEWGVDGIKVGVGPGSLCKTRVVTGCGYPQLSAIKNVAEEIKRSNDRLGKKITLIADGGIKYSGDIVKALAAGADSVMIGGMFKGTKETPGDILTAAFLEDGKMTEKKMKVFKGMASIDSQIRHLNKKKEEITAEGVATVIKCRGSVKDILKEAMKGVRSGFSYCGCRNIEEIHEYGSIPSSWIRCTNAGIDENKPHGV